MKINNEQNTGKTKPAQGGLHGVLGYIQTAGNLVKGGTIALLKADPFIRSYVYNNKIICFFRMAFSNGINKCPHPQGDDYRDVGDRVMQEKLPRAGGRVEIQSQNSRQGLQP